jgi:hypothetical protein
MREMRRKRRRAAGLQLNVSAAGESGVKPPQSKAVTGLRTVSKRIAASLSSFLDVEVASFLLISL